MHCQIFKHPPILTFITASVPTQKIKVLLYLQAFLYFSKTAPTFSYRLYNARL